MKFVTVNDKYEIRLASLVSNVDKDIIIELYQPIIGSEATILYLTLLKQKRNEVEPTLFETSNLINVMQVKPGDLLAGSEMLEGIGLMKTYLKKVEGHNQYIFVLYAPASPRDFFDDVLLKGLLVQAIGKEETDRLASSYSVDTKVPEGYEDITETFASVFTPNLNDSSFTHQINNKLLGRKQGKVKTAFNFDEFNSAIASRSQINTDLFTKEDYKEIERIAALFSIDENAMASIIIDEYNPHDENHLDFEAISYRAKIAIDMPNFKRRVTKSSVNSDSVLAKKIKIMDETSPREFLQLLQNNSKPALSDLNIVDSLSKHYGLPNGVINALIDYVLAKNNNVLSRNYCEKVASSLSREKVETTVDAMNYLNKINVVSKAKVDNSAIEKPSVESQNNENKKEITDDEFDSLLKELDNI